MIAYSLKNILGLVPSALEHVKQASVEQEFPLDNRDSVVASALSVQYCQHISGKSVDPFVMEKISRAIDLFDVRDVVEGLTREMVKEASIASQKAFQDPSRALLEKVAGFEGDLSGFVDLEDIHAKADALYKEAQELGVEPSEKVRRYSGNAFLNKQAALDALAARYQASGSVGFAKLASAIGMLQPESLKPETVQDICRTVTSMDKSAGISARGFDFYREALLTKQADFLKTMNVRLAGVDVPYDKVMRLGKDTISHYVGPDVAKELDGGPANFKQVLETLPLDLQRIVLDLTKNT
ncbi:MAG TPA: hypothetical protein VFM18_08680 [Methanosarcina sp.]|nr:hypothetical protein [Methanosarcina sp.]